MKNNLKDEREAFGLTQAQLAKILGLTTNGYARIERGERLPTKVHIAGMRTLYFISARDLLVDFLNCIENEVTNGR